MEEDGGAIGDEIEGKTGYFLSASYGFLGEKRPTLDKPPLEPAQILQRVSPDI